MKCTVTGIETENKYKGIPICREVMDIVKNLRAKNPKMSLREAIVQTHATYDKVKAANERNEKFNS